MAESPKEPYLMNKDEFDAHLDSKFTQFKRRSTASASNSNPKNPDSYCLPNGSGGLALIFVNEKFAKSEKRFLERRGSTKDRDDLIDLFRKKAFDVVHFENLSAVQMERVSKLVKDKYNLDGTSIFVCVILSHGGTENVDGCEESDVIYGSDGEFVPTSSIIKSFDCPQLEMKPKLFFIQACRGTKHDSGAQKDGKAVDGASNQGTASEQDAILTGTPPNVDPHEPISGELSSLNVIVRKQMIKTVKALAAYQDSLIMYASPPGYKSWREPDTGSWFIEHLRLRLADFDFFFDQDECGIKTVTLLQILTGVASDVAQKQVTLKDEEQTLTVKQVPTITLGLRKLILMKQNV